MPQKRKKYIKCVQSSNVSTIRKFVIKCKACVMEAFHRSKEYSLLKKGLFSTIIDGENDRKNLNGL